jgi:hypothetical protein
MPVAARINGFSLAYTAAGVIVLWSGIKGWTLSATFQNLLKGTTPTATSETIDTTSVEQSTSTSAAGSGGGSAAYNSSSKLEALWTANGGAQDTAAIAAAIGMAESSGSATVTSYNDVGGGTNVGIWQLETPGGVGSGYTVAELQNPDTNARLTVMATGNGRDWSQWEDSVADALPGHQYTPGDAVPGAVGAL